MKKNNEGYALPLVLVVMVVLSLVAITAMAGPLRNLQTQQASLKRMQDRYAAEGRIEMVVAQLCDEASMKDLSGTTESEAVKKKINAVCTAVTSDLNASYPSSEVEETAETGDETGTGDGSGTTGEPEAEITFPFTLTSIYDDVTIVCELTLTGTVKSGTEDDKYTIESPTITYNSYEITYGGGA